MKKVTLKVGAYVLAAMILAESAYVVVPAYLADETISMDDLQLAKSKAVNWLFSEQNEDGCFGSDSSLYYTA